MASKADLQKRVQELEAENDDLQDQLDQIADIALPPEEDESDDDLSDSDSSEDGDTD